MSELIPKVSVIIPVYNVEAYIAECLESIISQTLQEIEIICINDSATDGSNIILESYAQKDHRIRVIQNTTNKGLSYSRNKGLSVAKGKYIYFIDSDDLLKKEALKELYLLSEREQVEGVFFGARLISSDGRVELLEREKEFQCEYNGIFKGQDLFKLFEEERRNYSSVCMQFWKKSYIVENKFRFYEGIIYEDVLFSFKALIHATKVACISVNYYTYRLRSCSICSSQVTNYNIESLIKIYWESIKFIDQKKIINDIHLEKSIHNYLSKQIIISKNLSKKIKDKNVKNYSSHINILESHFKKIILGEELEFSTAIQLEKSKVVKYNENIVIYGAGAVGGRVLSLLNHYDVGIIGFAVSRRNDVMPKYIMGNKVFEIEELRHLTKTSLIVVAVTRRYQQEILSYLNQLEFENIMIIDEG